MVGQALTVFQGTKPEPFKVRVVSVMRNFLPKQDVILIRAEDPRVEFSGIVAGMSGSPVYIDGKLVGAVAYAWSFAKEPLGGVTPIETMLAERARPRRAGGEILAQNAPRPDSARGPDAMARGLGLPPMAPVAAAGAAGLVRASVPLSVAGFTPRTRRRADRRAAADRHGAACRPAAGAASARPRAGHVEPGSAIGVELVRGDMSTVATGTVTYIDRRNVFAFGHPLFGIGEVYLPLVDAEIHAFLPSLAQSFKMSSPLQRDRHAGAGPAVLHHRRPRRAHDHDADRRARDRPRRRAAPLPRRGGAQPAPHRRRWRRWWSATPSPTPSPTSPT